MSGFLYYIVGAGPGTKAADLSAIGLGYAFEGGAFTARPASRGPNDCAAGCVCADPTRIEPTSIGFWPDKQLWRRIPRLERDGENVEAYVGYTVGAQPGPLDLARAEQLAGHMVQMADGSRWLIPVATMYADDGTWHNRLPRSLGIDDDGEWTLQTVIARYERLWRYAEKWWDLRYASNVAAHVDADGNEQWTFDMSDAADAAIEAMQANYRIGRVEVAMLGLFTQGQIPSVLDALVDAPTVAEFMQKKMAETEVSQCDSAHDGSDTDDGEPVETVPIARHSQTSPL